LIYRKIILRPGGEVCTHKLVGTRLFEWTISDKGRYHSQADAEFG